MIKNILLIEDDKSLSNGIVLALQSSSVSLAQCFNIASARNKLAKENFDLVILDINLPDGNGLNYLCELKKARTIPVILLTANDMETDIVTGLEMGADDYITKPFSLAVLRARVNVRLRRQTIFPIDYEQDGFQFDFHKMEFLKNGKTLELSKTEQKLLRILIENKGITLGRDLLIDAIWTDGAAYVDENALSVTIKRLRDKLEDSPSKPQYIKTIYGLGYSWVVK